MEGDGLLNIISALRAGGLFMYLTCCRPEKDRKDKR